MTAFIHHFTYEFKTGLRNATLLLMNYLFPIGFYLMMGLIMAQINPDFRDGMIPAMIVFIFMVGLLLGMPGPLVEAREAGVYRSFLVNGVPAASILAVPALSTIFHAVLASSFVAFTAESFFQAATPVHWWNLVGIALLTAFALGGLGALIAVVSSGARSTVLWAQAVFLPSMMLGGLMIPLDILPEGMHTVAKLLPPTHAMQALLATAYGQETLIVPEVAITALLAGGLIAMLLALRLFDWGSQGGARNRYPILGLLALLPYVVASVIG